MKLIRRRKGISQIFLIGTQMVRLVVENDQNERSFVLQCPTRNLNSTGLSVSITGMFSQRLGHHPCDNIEYDDTGI
jgi:hypothetical protein